MEKSVFLLTVIISFLVLADNVFGNVNLYISRKEVQRLIGVAGDLTYVRDGKVYPSAVKFNLPVPPEINKLYFTWYARGIVYYSIRLTSEDSEILSGLSMNISHEGRVPQHLSVFQVSMRCSGVKSGSVEFVVQIALSLLSHSNLTFLHLKRNKTCLADGNFPSRVAADSQKNTSVLVRRPSFNVLTTTNVFYIAIGCVCGLIILLVVVVALIHFLTVKQPEPGKSNGSDASSTGLLAHSVTSTLYNKPLPGSIAPRIEFTMLQDPMLCLCDTENLKARLEDIAVEKCRVTFGDIILEGTFGRIYEGTLAPCPGSETESQSQATEKEILIKTVGVHASEKQRELLLSDSCLLHGLSHKNILSLMNVVTEDPPMVIFPFLSLGNLKKFLRDGRIGSGDKHQAISTRDLVHLAIQITHGMMYLGKRKVVHRDIATRNCVIDEYFNLKLTDNALSRDIFPSDYHCLGDNENRPVKWMAVESLVERKFTPSSDVWAFGITLWELVTFGQTPYADLDPFEMVGYLRSGYRMAQPHTCPDELFSLMACCWALMPQDRPKFSQLCAALTDFHRALGIYI